MPLVKRNIEPRHLCRGALPDGVTSELECVTNSTLAAIIKQLGGLSRHAEDIFGELFNEANNFYLRMSSLQERVDQLAVKVTQLDSTVEEVSLQDINMRKAFKSSTIQDQQVVSRTSVPNPVVEMYHRCDKPPPLNILSPYRDDKKDALKFYTDPSYFFNLWKEKMLQATEDKRKEKRRQKVRRRASACHRPPRLAPNSCCCSRRWWRSIHPAREQPEQGAGLNAPACLSRVSVGLSGPPRQAPLQTGPTQEPLAHLCKTTPDLPPHPPVHPASCALPAVPGCRGNCVATVEALVCVCECESGGVVERDLAPGWPPTSYPDLSGLLEGAQGSQPPPGVTPGWPPPPTMACPQRGPCPPTAGILVGGVRPVAAPCWWPLTAVALAPPTGPWRPTPTRPAPTTPPPRPWAPPTPASITPGSTQLIGGFPPAPPEARPPPSRSTTCAQAHPSPQHPSGGHPAVDGASRKSTMLGMIPMSDARSDLLAAIRRGIQLRKVQEQREQEAKREPVGNDVATILSRRIAVEYSESDDDSELDENEWSD
uniref:Wiskott-Aldrich syndrome protein family member n=1 Tax=Tetraodon nigroviridis TaxID=99883 RepID=H3DMP7_TETNG